MPALSRPSQKVKPLAEGRLVSVPPVTTSPAQPGDFARDAAFFYIYTGNGKTHAWRKIAHVAL